MKFRSHVVVGLFAWPLSVGCSASTPSTLVEYEEGAGGTSTVGDQAGAGGSTAIGGATGTGGTTAVSVTVSPSNIPAPPKSGVAKPAGGDANLKVLDWAGWKGAASFSFDDSQPSQIEHYADLQATGVRVTFCAATNGSWAQGYDTTFAQAVKDGHEIGNHTVTHCNANLTGCPTGATPLSTTDAEIDQCSDHITHAFGQKAVWSMAYPYGDMAYEQYAKKRFFLGHGAGNGFVAPNDATDPFNLPAYGAKAGEDATVFNGLLDQVRDAGKWIIFTFHSLLPTTYNWYANVDIGSVTGSIAHGKSEMWLDTVGNVGAYWIGQKLLTSAQPAASATGKTWLWTLPPHFPTGKYVRVTVDGGTLRQQGGTTLPWDDHGYYEVALDVGSLEWTP